MSNLIFDATPFRCVIIDKMQNPDITETHSHKIIKTKMPNYRILQTINYNPPKLQCIIKKIEQALDFVKNANIALTTCWDYIPLDYH